MMKRYNNLICTMLAALLLLAACEKTEPDENVGTSCTKLRITTAPLTIVGEQVPYDTRAATAN